MDRRETVFAVLRTLNITYQLHEHPPIPTIELALPFWNQINSAHCKNLFFRNHKRNKHFLVILDHRQQLDVHDLEKRLKQGKITFASERRMTQYLGLTAGSVSPFGLINDIKNQVYLFIDEELKKAEKISFHPNDNTATLVLLMADFIQFLNMSGNAYEFIKMYE